MFAAVGDVTLSCLVGVIEIGRASGTVGSAAPNEKGPRVRPCDDFVRVSQLSPRTPFTSPEKGEHQAACGRRLAGADAKHRLGHNVRGVNLQATPLTRLAYARHPLPVRTGRGSAPRSWIDGSGVRFFDQHIGRAGNREGIVAFDEPAIERTDQNSADDEPYGARRPSNEARRIVSDE
jgi:hypothetical protein